MSLQYHLRLPLVCLILSVVGCFPELSLGDTSENDPKIKKQALENFRRVKPVFQNSVSNLQSNTKQFNKQYQLLRINSTLFSRRNDGNAKNSSFSPTEARASADIYYRSAPNMISSNVNSQNNPVELSSVKYNNGIDAKRSYAFQMGQRKPNPFSLTANQKSSSDINLAPWLMKKGLTNGMHAANEFRSGSFGYQHISESKSEMYSDSSRPLGLNDPYLRKTMSAPPIIRLAHAERIPTDYMSGSSTEKYDTSGGNVQFDNLLQNNGQNQKAQRKVVPSSTSFSIVRANQKASKSLTHAFSAGNKVTSFENMRGVAVSKVFKPPAVQTPITPVIKKSNSNGGPLKKAHLFSSQHDQVKQSNSERVASLKANPESSFKYGMSSYTHMAQNGYQSRAQSSQNSAPIYRFQSQKKHDHLATGMSAIRPLETNAARSYKGILSDENIGIRSPTAALSNQKKKDTHLYSQIHFPKNTLVHDTHFNLPDPTYHSLRKPSQHNVRNRTDLKSSGQSTVQSLVTKNYPVPGNTMKNVHSISPSLSAYQGTSKNVGMPSNQTQPYYLTSKKPFAFRGLIFVPTMPSLQKTEMHSGQKTFINSSSNVQYVSPYPRNTLSVLAQKPLTPNSYEKTHFQNNDIQTSQEKQPDQTDSSDNGLQRETVSSTEVVTNTMSDLPNALAMRVIGTNTSAGLGTNNGAASLQNYPKMGYDRFKLNKVQSKTPPRLISSRFTSAQNTQAQTESNIGELPTVRFSNARFVGPNTYSASMKSSNSPENPTAELVLPVQKSTLLNKKTGYPQIGNAAVIQPLQRYNFKENEGLVNPVKESKKDRNSRPTSSIVISKPVEVTQEGENSSKDIYAIPSSQSAIYRAADIISHKTNSSSIIYRPAKKHYSKSKILPSALTNETTQISKMDLDLSAVGVSQASSPTSSFVVGRYVNTVNKVSSKPNLNMSSTRTGLNKYKPVQFSDIAGSASFIKPHSANSKAVDLGSVQNRSSSTPLKEESFKELLFDSTIGNSSITSALQNETDESTVDLSGPEFMTTAAIDLTTESPLPQLTVYSSKPHLDPTPTAEGIGPFYEVTLIPNTTLLVTITSE